MTRTNRTYVFRFILLSIPFLFFVGLEFVLRVSGYGVDLPLFIDTPDSKNYSLARPDIIKRYFPTNAKIPSITLETNLFLKNKPKNAIRVFIQGGSTAAGFPYGFGASPAGMLDQRLQKTFPNKTVEVINTAMSAVNSYTVLDFVDEIIEQKPDAIVIYAGHNEFLGILGVGSNYTATNSYTSNLLFLKLKKYRVFQLVQNSYNKFLVSDRGASEANSSDKRTFMATVAKHKNIKLNSELFNKAVEQFENNLDLILKKYNDAKIPVFISTLASNLKDHPPFSSKPINTSTTALLNSLAKEIEQSKNSHRIEQLLSELTKKVNINGSAQLHFDLAKLYLELNRPRLALSNYISAKENDLLRFRASEKMNQSIRKIANRHDATVVDYQLSLSKSSPNNIVGDNFMLEHLHPNLQGYFILSDTIYNAMKKENIFGSWSNAVSTSAAWKQRPILPAEEYSGFAKIIQLKSDYPFTNTPKKVVLPKPNDWTQELGLQYFLKKIDWLTMMNRSYRGYLEERNLSMIYKTSQIIADAMPQNDEANFRVGTMLMQQNDKLAARIYFERAVLEEPENEVYLKAFDNSK